MLDAAMVQKAYTAVVEHFIGNGRAPHYTELAATLGVTPDEARQLQHEAAASAVACWFMQDADYVESWAPFSNIPTQYLVTIDGVQKWYGQGGLEVLAVRWLYPGTEIRINTRCLDCAEPIRIRMRDEEILEIDPPTAVGHTNVPFGKLLAGAMTFGFGGSRMNLFRSEEHVKSWSQYDPASAEGILPVANWAMALSGPLFRKRLEPDYLARTEEYVGKLVAFMKEAGLTSRFWLPG